MVNERVSVYIKRAFRLMVAADIFVAALMVAAWVHPTRASDPVESWTFDTYDSQAVRYQDPDYNACAAASAQIMLNTIALQSDQDTILVRPTQQRWSILSWRTDSSYAKQESILAYERANMTMLASSPGTDPHGWRNALNYFGWGTASAGVYRDAAYGTYREAARATVIAIARYGRPVGILARAGKHAQVVTGVVVTGADPRVSDDFELTGVYITDPLRSDAMRDFFVGDSAWESGPVTVRFDAYAETDSPYTDPIDGNAGTAEWSGKWVVIEPVK